jgi:hypothetical protein
VGETFDLVDGAGATVKVGIWAPVARKPCKEPHFVRFEVSNKFLKWLFGHGREPHKQVSKSNPHQRKLFPPLCMTPASGKWFKKTCLHGAGLSRGQSLVSSLHQKPRLFSQLRGASRPHRAGVEKTTSLAHFTFPSGFPKVAVADTKTDTKGVKTGMVGLC